MPQHSHNTQPRIAGALRIQSQQCWRHTQSAEYVKAMIGDRFDNNVYIYILVIYIYGTPTQDLHFKQI